MPSQTWKLIDVTDGTAVPQQTITAQDVPGAPEGFAITKRRLAGGLSQGVDELQIDNGRFRFSLLPTRGMGIWKAWLGDWTVGWQSPVRGPVHPKFVPLHEPSGLGWLDGFDELLCRCGLVSNGAPDFDESGRLAFPLHGRIANRPAHFLQVQLEDDEITVVGVVEETRFHFTKLRLITTIKTRFGEPGLRIDDRVENFSGTEAEMQMLYHTNFGVPLLGAGAEVVAPVEVLVPRNDWAAEGVGHWSTYNEPTAGMEERVYFFKLAADGQGQTQTLLKSADGARGVSLQYDVRQLPCFTLWKNETAVSDGYVTGLEPGTNFPNPRSFEGEQGRVVKLAPGQSHRMQLALQLHANRQEVAKTEQAIAQLRPATPTIHNSPQPGWCA